jgi:murein DD-endopeptidase MepM/ murein hydrolase activator NlpD
MGGRFRVLHLLLIAGALASCQQSSDRENRHQHHDIPLGVDENVLEAVVPPDATLDSLLRQQLPSDLSSSIVNAVRGVFDPRELQPDRSYRITRSLNGLFREFRYQIDADRFLRVVFHDDPDAAAAAFDAEVVVLPRQYEIAAASAEISREHNSLFAAFESAGENIQLSRQVADVFAGELDFNADLRLGDRVDVLFDRAMRDGAFVGYGDVRAAILHTGARRVAAIRFVGADGSAEWYDEQGRSLRRQFLKSPLPFDPRVTSGFSTNRFHPVLGFFRPHLGVDFGAPYGTFVKAVASGVIEFAGWSGEAGRMVRIRHAGGYETAYLHLSSFGPGIRPGTRVEQGQLIGRVGQSGTATGPHLDYRVLRNGVYVNPLTEFSRMPVGEPLSSAELPTFFAARDQALRDLTARLDAPRPSTLRAAAVN